MSLIVDDLPPFGVKLFVGDANAAADKAMLEGNDIAIVVNCAVNLDIDYAANAAFSHAWSLCVEEHFYLLFPALALLLARRPSAMKFWTACIVVLVGGTWGLNGIIAVGRPGVREI